MKDVRFFLKKRIEEAGFQNSSKYIQRLYKLLQTDYDNSILGSTSVSPGLIDAILKSVDDYIFDEYAPELYDVTGWITTSEKESIYELIIEIKKMK